MAAWRVRAYPVGMSSDRPEARDPAEAMDELVFDAFRRMSPAERLELAAAASRSLEELSIAGLRQRFAGLPQEELRRRAGVIRLGADLARRAFGAGATAWLE